MALDPFYWLAGILEGEGTFMSGPPSRPNALPSFGRDRWLHEQGSACVELARGPAGRRGHVLVDLRQEEKLLPGDLTEHVRRLRCSESGKAPRGPFRRLT